LPEVPKSLKNSSSRSHTLTSVDIVTGMRDTGYPPGMTDREIYTDEEYVCTPKSLVIVSVLMVVLINVGMIIGFAMFYRMRKKFWKNGDSSPLHNFTPVPVPEVLFRSVYGQLPPNPSFANLGHPLSN